MLRAGFIILFFCFTSIVQAQTLIRGYVLDHEGHPLPNASIQSLSSDQFSYSNNSGYFELDFLDLDQIRIEVRYLGYQSIDSTISLPQQQALVFKLQIAANTLDAIDVQENRFEPILSENPNNLKITSQNLDLAPGPSMDFNQILKTLPGVSSNNELSSSYQVRGGNFDENLVYVNDIPVYRPFLSNTGRQEGLSFVNPSLVKDVSFYAGGWEAKYGDKLSSSLNITYKEPAESEGNIIASLLGGSLYVGNRSKNERISYLLAARHRDTRYLLNSLEVNGAYFPKFSDVQSFVTMDLTKRSLEQQNKTKLGWLVNYSRNRYLTLPTSQVTEFGSVTANLRIQTAFDGREQLDYDTYQTGINLSHLWNAKLASQIIASYVYTQEQENFEVEGVYRLCDVDNNPNSTSFDECIITRGLGAQYDYGRNTLDAQIIQIENRNTWLIDDQKIVEFGLGIQNTSIEDDINEYSFTDSADFVKFNETVFNNLSLSYTNVTGYLQATNYSEDSSQRLHGGVRINHWTQNGQTLISPRISYSFRGTQERAGTLSLTIGSYQQPAFYRELRDYDGSINTQINAQASYHLIAGWEKPLIFWNRPFLLNTQLYLKWLTNLIPYDIENMRLRYHTNQPAKGYATGIDIRLYGEFIPGTQSWFSLGYLKTSENLTQYDFGWQRRPTDQRIQLGVYFEDHLPDDPSWRVYTNLQFGSGFAFGPPNNLTLRGAFQGDEYYRADIGLSKSFEIDRGIMQQGWIRLEVLNALGADNTLSYSWIQDVTGASFAIPNSLSARLLNIKVGFSL